MSERSGGDAGPATMFNILLVDDRPENLIALEAVLADLGQNIVKARSGAEALREVLRRDFVVILLDVNMPDMDGFETAALIRQRKQSKYTPIIFVTAWQSSETYRSLGYALGAVDYVFTPVDPGILRAKVAAFIELARKEELARSQAEIERAAAERRAALLESRLQSLCNRLEVGIFRASLDGRLVEANPAFLRLIGRTSLEPLRADEVFRSNEARAVAMRRLVSYREDRAATDEEEIELTMPDGTAAFVSVAKTLSAGPDGVLYVEGLVTDITRRKRTTEERERLLASERAARADAEIANRVKDEFLATLSHELRTPLHAILGWVQVLRHPQSPPEQLPVGLETIERNARVQTRLIEDLLDMSRIMSGKIRLDVKEVDLAEVVDGVIASFQPAIEAKRIAVERRFQDGAGVLRCDPGRMQQTVWNLLSNAIKFTGEDGRVSVALERDGPHVRLTVADDGQGIAPEFLPRIFERFRQEDQSLRRTHSGLGLGLAIVRHLVELHGGAVAAKSDGPGRGATFQILLPLRAVIQDPAAIERPRSTPPLEIEHGDVPALEGVNVLVVDDDDDARDLMRRVLEERGARVTSVSSALLALEAIAQEIPRVLVSDIGMPVVDGYELMARIRALPPERGGRMVALAVTAFARQEDRDRALAAGYDDHLAKPLEPWRLVRAIAALACLGVSERARVAAG